MADKDFTLRLAARYLGQKGAIDDGSMALLEKAYSLVKDDASPRYSYVQFPIEKRGDDILVVGTNIVLKGDSIKRHLQTANAVILTAFTLGTKIDIEQKKLNIVDITIATAYDAVASAYAESEADITLKQVKDKIKEDGKYTNGRFACGYGDFPLTTNIDICKAISADKIGITYLESGLLLPRKSIVGVVGIFDNEKKEFED